MRFVLAIVAFVVAAVMIAVGIAQRTVFAPLSQVAMSATVKGDPRYIVIDGAVLNAHPGQQTLAVSGSTSKTQVVAYGRTADVKAWLGGPDVLAHVVRHGEGHAQDHDGEGCRRVGWVGRAGQRLDLNAGVERLGSSDHCAVDHRSIDQQAIDRHRSRRGGTESHGV
ncbi:hypothetical protein [Leifsonia poae]|uniref:hypothetical protein n=1 Tax=Leifsonia poae TaxID=110933 RepID=UPI003D677681